MTDLNQPDGQQPRAADPDAVLTRSEEKLWITTHRRETERARLIKYLETETQTRTVEVRHEQARVAYEPISADTRDTPATAAAGSALSGDGWLVLYDEEIVVQTRWVARERVRLATHSVIEEREISEDVRREQIEIDDTTHGG